MLNCLLRNYWRCLMLWNFTSWSRLKLSCPYLMRPIFHKFFINLAMWLVLMLKNNFLCQCKIINATRTLNVFLILKTVICCFHLEHHNQHGLFCSKFLQILAPRTWFTHQKWISKTTYWKLQLALTLKASSVDSRRK